MDPPGFDKTGFAGRERAFRHRPTAPIRGPPLPLPGTLLIRECQGRDIVVTVRDRAVFEYEGGRYKSLSAIAREVTGSRWNGYLFFGLTKPRTSPKVSERGTE